MNSEPFFSFEQPIFKIWSNQINFEKLAPGSQVKNWKVNVEAPRWIFPQLSPVGWVTEAGDQEHIKAAVSPFQSPGGAEQTALCGDGILSE